MSVYRTTPRTPSRQKGAAILVITILLLLVATIGTLMVGRTGVTEQKIVGTDVRSKEVYSTANGGLETAVSWFEEYYEDLNWSDCGDTLCAGIPDDHPDQPSLNTELGADDYSGSITYTLRSQDLDARPLIVTASTTATANNDSHVEKAVAVDVMLGTTSIFSSTATPADPAVFEGPPIMVEACMNDVTGNPSIHPGEDGIAIGTTDGAVSCVDSGNFDLNGGSISALEPPSSIARATFEVPIFDTSRPCNGIERSDVGSDEEFFYVCEENYVYAMLRGMEEEDPERVFVVDDAGSADTSLRPILGQPGEPSYPRYSGQDPLNGNNWHNDVGSEEEPVILYFDRSVGCPKINGNTDVWGLVYYAAKDCDTHGWGSGEVHGTVAIRGTMEKHTANANIYGESLDFSPGGSSEGDSQIDVGFHEEEQFSEIPGSWRDF